VRAILLAAGQGLRMQFPSDRQVPKCLLRFGDTSLLERHWQMLRAAGIEEVVLAVGFRRELIEAELARLNWHPQLVTNERFELGSMLTLHTVAEAMTRGGDVLLMDADVLYHERIMRLLAEGERSVNRLLIDHGFDAGDEPVKICVRGGTPIELRKKLSPELQYDTIGESVGFFRFDESAARRLAQLVAGYIEQSRADLPHEEAVRDLIQENSHVFEVTDVTGVPWIEIDFAADVMRATREVLPRLKLAAESLQPAATVSNRRKRTARSE
jgi:choline kinase